MYAHINWSYWKGAGGGSPKSPIYGIWNVDRVSINGEVGPTELNDYDRQWRRLIFDSPDSMVFQRLDDSFARYRVSIDQSNNSLTLSKGNSQQWKAYFTFQRPSQDRLILDGEMDGYRIQTQLHLLEFDTLRLLNSDFRWVRPNDP
jgi:hypothetical protein